MDALDTFIFVLLVGGAVVVFLRRAERHRAQRATLLLGAPLRRPE